MTRFRKGKAMSVAMPRRITVSTAVLAVVLVAVRGPARAADLWPLPTWPTATPREMGLDEASLDETRDYALTGGGSGFIIRGGRLVLSWGDPAHRYDLKSTTKSFGAAALGLAIKDGKMRLTDRARAHHPTLEIPPDSNARTGWLDEITILHLASQTAGFDKPRATCRSSSGRGRNGPTATPAPTGWRNASRSPTTATWIS